MAEKKPSKYSDRGTIGSAEELDTYGVWVKSEPQDLTAGMTEAVNLDAEAVPYADFDMEFDDSQESDFDFPGLEPEIPEISIEGDEDDDNDNFSDGIAAATIEQSGEEASTRLLMKIADELSAIRSELSTLKKEFAGVRIETVPGVKAETRHGGFFDGEEGDDEKITLTGDEMENILTSADFSTEEDIGFDAQREADEAALKELSEQNESAAETDEEIEIDFDNLGIKLDNDIETEAQDEFPPLEEIPSEEVQEELMPLKPFEEDDEELQDLRREGAVPLTPAPDDSIYLETDPFALDDSGLEDTPLEEASIEEAFPAESGLNENTLPEETVFQDTASEITTDLSFDQVGFDLNTDDFSIDESLPPLEEETDKEQTDVGAVGLSAESTSSLEDEISQDETIEEEISGEQAFDTESLDLSEAVIDEPDLSAGIVEAPLEEPVLDDISFGDDLSLDMDDFGSGIDIDIKDNDSADELTDEPVESLAVENLAAVENLSIDDSNTSVELGAEEELSLADDLVMDDVETSVELDTEAGGPAGGLADDLVIDDVETSVELDTEAGGPADGLAGDLVMDDVETSVELDTEAGGPAGGLTDDLADDLALDDFDTGIDLAELPTALPDEEEDSKTAGDRGFADADDSLDDGLTGVIPEGFEVNAEEAPVSLDDDLEAFADEEISLPEAPTAKTTEADADRDIDIPANFKSELKSVLSYMDHLLESLPEDKIEEFAKSEYFDSYKKIFKELGLV